MALVQRSGSWVQGCGLNMIYFQSSNIGRCGRHLSSLYDLTCSKMFACQNIYLHQLVMDSANSWYYILCHLLQQWFLTLSESQTSFGEYEENSRHSSPQNGIHVPSSQPRDRLKPLLLWVFGSNVSKNPKGFCQLGIICEQIDPSMSFSLCVFTYYNIFSSGN